MCSRCPLLAEAGSGRNDPDVVRTALRGEHEYPYPMLTLARRVMTALSLAGLIAALFRLRGSGGVPPQTGGWKEITDSELA